MIGNGRRGERDRDTEDEDEVREERSSEGGGGFGGWRNHLLGGLTQRVKSWYWGARPLVSYAQRKEKQKIKAHTKKKNKFSRIFTKIIIRHDDEFLFFFRKLFMDTIESTNLIN